MMKIPVKVLVIAFCGIYVFLHISALSTIMKYILFKHPRVYESQKKLLKSVRFSEFQSNTTRKDRYHWTEKEQSDNMLSKFAPALNETEYMWFLDIIQKFKATCESYNITYMIVGGSVLGAYRYHGFVPWDEDFDVQVNLPQNESLNKALLSVTGYGLYTNAHFQWKFYNVNQGKRTRYKWNWPLIDIFFFDVNKTHIYDVTHGKRKDVYLRSELLPLQSGLFENLILPVPYNITAYLWKRYPMEDPCKSHWWDHKKQKRATPVRIPCAYLLNVYAFVHRFKSGSISYEDLRLGNKTLYRLETA